ncbi:MAG: hypothetical protein AAFY20_26725 [Cyanobacteria bacterium J06639_14]
MRQASPSLRLGFGLRFIAPVGRDGDYARLKAEKAMGGKSRSRGLKKVGSADHRDWQTRIQQRDALLEIERRWRSHSRGVSRVLQTMIDTPIWEP